MKRDYKYTGLITATVSQELTELSGDRTAVFLGSQLMQGRCHSSETTHFLTISQTKVNTERKVTYHHGSHQIQSNKLPEGNLKEPVQI